MKHRIFFALIAILALTLACTVSAPATQQVNTVETVVASTLNALTPSVPLTEAPATDAPTQAAPAGTPFSFQNVSFVIPPDLALGANGEAVPVMTEESGAPWDVAPAHVHITFYGYNDVLARFSVMEISVFPAQEYAAVNLGAQSNLGRLQSALASSSTSLDLTQLPRVPYFNAAAHFNAQVKLIDFANGKGVRMITQYGQAVGPVTNSGMMYHFQGLTADGKYYVIVVLPIGASYLDSGQQFNPDNPNLGLPADGVPFPGYTSMDPKDYESYYQAIVDKINATDPNVFSPALPLLDALIQSITVTP